MPSNYYLVIFLQFYSALHAVQVDEQPQTNQTTPPAITFKIQQQITCLSYKEKLDKLLEQNRIDYLDYQDFSRQIQHDPFANLGPVFTEIAQLCQ